MSASAALLQHLDPAAQNAMNEAPGSALPVMRLSPIDSSLIQHAQRLGNVRSLREFGYGLANALCNQLQCEQVGVGIARRSNIEVIAISGCAAFKASSPGVADLRQAMEECLDHRELVAYPGVAGIDQLPIHRNWSIATGCSEICSLPLIADEQHVGVITLRRPAGMRFSPKLIEELSVSLCPLGTLLTLVDRANQSLPSHATNVVHEWLNAYRTRMRLLAVACLLILGIWFCFGTVSYRPLCDSVVVASELRNMTAPFESRLEKVHAQAGSRAKAGDVLVEFDTTQPRLELETVRAEITQTQVNERAAIKAGDATSAALHHAHLQVLTARQTALQRRIESARLLAPNDGMVIQSNFDKRLGQVFDQGEPVLQFAPSDGWMLDIHVPEDAAIYVEPNQSGAFASAARPHEKIAFEVGQIDGSASVVDNRNVFLARAELAENPEWMRSGMQGFAQIHTVRKPVWWVALHKFIDWTRLRFWL